MDQIDVCTLQPISHIRNHACLWQAVVIHKAIYCEWIERGTGIDISKTARGLPGAQADGRCRRLRVATVVT